MTYGVIHQEESGYSADDLNVTQVEISHHESINTDFALQKKTMSTFG
jgi:hypothetical protein